MKLSVCTTCGTPYDETGYEQCPDCQYDHTFIQLRKDNEETNNKSRQDGKSGQSNEGI